MTVGIDSAKNRVDAVMLLANRVIDVQTFDLKQAKGMDRSEVMKVLRAKTAGWLAQCKLPCEVFVEQAIMLQNRQTCIALAQTVGMLLTLPSPVHLVPIDSWKQVAVGKGGASKEEVRDAIVRQIPETDDLFGKRQDLFDACGVALFGQDQLRR